MRVDETHLGKVSEFFLIKKLGQGSFGNVHLGQSSASTNYVAIKSAKRDNKNNPVSAFNRLIMTEGVILKQLSHQNIVKLYRQIEEDGVQHLVMELVAGQDLDKMIINRTLSSKDTMDIFKHLMLGLAYMHGRGIVHRDVKPSRLIL